MSHTIRAAVLNAAPGDLEIEQLTLGEPGADEVLIRICYAGLCHSDLHEMNGTFPTTTPILLGHEAAGFVEAVGANVTSVSPGDRVVTCLSIFCGHCRYCLSGRLTLCTNRSATALKDPGRLRNHAGQPVRPTAGIGAFAEKAVVHHHGVAVVPADIPLSRASILGCAVTTGYGAVVHRARVRPGSSVAVVGTGGVGIAAIQAARISGATTIIAVDVDEPKLDLARAFGATDIINASSVDPVVEAIRITEGGVDYAFEAVGRARTVEQCVAMLRNGGVATVIGMVPRDPPIQLDGADLFFAEKTLQGSFMGSNQFPSDIGNFVAMYRSGILDLDNMITDVVDFDDINAGFRRLGSGKALRIVAKIAPEPSTS